MRITKDLLKARMEATMNDSDVKSAEYRVANLVKTAIPLTKQQQENSEMRSTL